MTWREALSTARMERIALVAPTNRLRDLLERVGDAGVVELDEVPSNGGRRPGDGTLDGRENAREAAIAERACNAVVRDEVAAVAGWVPADEVAALTTNVAGAGAAIVPLPRPRGVDAPTLLRGSDLRRSLTPLVETYGTVPYADIDPTVLAAVSYVLMFGMMFGDVGHGLLLLAVAIALRAGRPRRLARFSRAWPFLAGGGVVSALFGLFYGEAFGPTGLVPVVWLAPLEEPVQLLLAALGLGALLLASAYAVGTINRWREGGWPLAVLASSGVAGASLLGSVGLLVAGWYVHNLWLAAAGGVLAASGLGLAFTGFVVQSGGGGTGWAQASIELFDAVIRLGSNIVSFARLAAFGMTHAALGAVVWDATSGLGSRGAAGIVAAAVVFTVGNALAFALEALVAAVQALRLEYYELFSRVFQGEGRPFRPWRLPQIGEGDLT